eukprot:gene10090-biopygen9304
MKTELESNGVSGTFATGLTHILGIFEGAAARWPWPPHRQERQRQGEPRGVQRKPLHSCGPSRSHDDGRWLERSSAHRAMLQEGINPPPTWRAAKAVKHCRHGTATGFGIQRFTCTEFRSQQKTLAASCLSWKEHWELLLRGAPVLRSRFRAPQTQLSQGIEFRAALPKSDQPSSHLAVKQDKEVREATATARHAAG